MNENRNFLDKKEIKKYKEFAFKEDMLKMSIAFILGTAFNKVVTGISNLIIMPFVNFIIHQTGESWRKLNIEVVKGLKIEVGEFLGVLVDFILISIILYLIYGKIISGLVSNKNNTIEFKKCPLCYSQINSIAKKCPHCTGDLNVES